MADEQLFGTSIAEIIKKRISVRTYLAQPLSPNRKRWDELFFNCNFSHPLSESGAGKYVIPF